MDFSVIGSAQGYARNWKLQQQWALKRQSGDVSGHDADLSTLLKQRKTAAASLYQKQIDDARENRDGDKGKLEKIMNKVYAGKKLSAKEKEYLKAKSPETYQLIKNAEDDQKRYEQELRRCRTKEEVQRVKMSHMNAALQTVKSVANDPNIPDEKKRAILSIQKAHTERLDGITRDFVKRGDYEKLPTEAEKARAEKELKEAREAEETARIEKEDVRPGPEDEAPAEEPAGEDPTVEKTGEAARKTEREVEEESPEARKVRRAKARAAYGAISGDASAAFEEPTVRLEA